MAGGGRGWWDTQQTGGARAHTRIKRAGPGIRLRKKSSINGARAKTCSREKCADVRDPCFSHCPCFAHCPSHDATETWPKMRPLEFVRTQCSRGARDSCVACGRSSAVNSDLAVAPTGVHSRQPVGRRPFRHWSALGLGPNQVAHRNQLYRAKA